MRRTARALSLAAVAGTVIGVVCAPAAFAEDVPAGGSSWGTASSSPCPQPEGQEWQEHETRSSEPGAGEPEALITETPEPEAGEPETLATETPEPEALEPGALEPGAAVPGGTSLDELIPDAPASEGGAGEIPAPGAGGPTAPGTAQPSAPDPKHTASEHTGPEHTGPEHTGPTDHASKGPEPGEGDPKDSHCADAPVHRGVHAGEGGVFTDSVPALAAGGLLIAGALGAAAHRLYRDRDRAARTDG
ncbi:hypothetical protein ACF07S_23995 [Streptomyces sp. NPDC016640]|uniref:hypothetical protein n=1 Tax=Streptomyces sp. NPDC016640 TaxID=3364969 RepID=UPI0036F972F8